jgi:SOS-response transcriptional repressor LexA
LDDASEFIKRYYDNGETARLVNYNDLFPERIVDKQKIKVIYRTVTRHAKAEIIT